MRREPDFEASADMRLVELQRAALGVPPPDRGAWETRVSTEGSAVEAEGHQHLESAVLAVELTATPPGEVIPGAIVTLAFSLANDGVQAARNVHAAVPLPGGAAYRNGSFVRDGRPQLDDAADELFGTGIALGNIAPKSRVTFLWKVGVRLGNKPLVIAPTVTADETAIVGGKPAMVSRKAGAEAGFATQVQRFDRALYDQDRPSLEELPIYELDAEEELEHEAADAALGEYRPPMEPPSQPIAPPSQPEPAPPPDQPAPDPEPGVPVEEPSIPAPPEQPPDIEPAAREAVVLYGRLDRPSIAYFERIFSGSKPPTLLNHFILGGALACTRALDQSDVAGLKAHMDAQAQLLQRIVLHEKMGRKEPIAEYAGSMLARVDQFVPSPVQPAAAPESGAIGLETELETPTLGVLAKMQEDSGRWDFTKARQLTLALQARRVHAAAPEERVEAAEAALRNYAQTAATQLQRFFVRMRIDRTTGLLFAHDEALDSAARGLIAALIALF